MGRRSSSQGCVATGNQGASCSRQPRPLWLPLNPLECEQFQRANYRILIEERSYHEIADALLDEHVFHRRAWRVGGEILDEHEFAVGEDAFIDGPSEF